MSPGGWATLTRKYNAGFPFNTDQNKWWHAILPMRFPLSHSWKFT